MSAANQLNRNRFWINTAYHYSLSVLLRLKTSHLPSLQHIKTLQFQYWLLLFFWTSLPKQQPGIVIEQLNDDENEWKGRYEFPACRHAHTSQVWFQEQLCGFNLPLPLLVLAHTKTHPCTRKHTAACARACIRLHAHGNTQTGATF